MATKPVMPEPRDPPGMDALLALKARQESIDAMRAYIVQRAQQVADAVPAVQDVGDADRQTLIALDQQLEVLCAELRTLQRIIRVCIASPA